MEFQNSIVLLRGLPGSGKSTLAKVLSEGGTYPVYSVDDYFTDENGNYHFEFDKNHLAYKNCENQTRNALIRGEKKIIIHNVFSMEWEMEPYFKLASEYSYSIFVCTVENRHGKANIHGIPDDQLDKMAAKFRIKLL